MSPGEHSEAMETNQARSTAVAVAFAALVLAAAAALALTVSGGSSTVLAADPPASAAGAAQSEINVTTDGSGVEQATTAVTTAGTTEGAAGSTEATPANNTERNSDEATSARQSDGSDDDLRTNGTVDNADTEGETAATQDDAAAASGDTTAEPAEIDASGSASDPQTETNDAATQDSATEDAAANDNATGQAAADDTAADAPAAAGDAGNPAAATPDANSPADADSSAADDGAGAATPAPAEEEECLLYATGVDGQPDGCFDGDIAICNLAVGGCAPLENCNDCLGVIDGVVELDGSEAGTGIVEIGCDNASRPSEDGSLLALPCDSTEAAEPAPAAPAADAGPSATTPDVTNAATPGSDEPAIVTPVAPAPADTPDVVEIGCSGEQTLIDGICQTPPPAAPATIAGGNVDTPGDDNPNVIAPVSPNGSDDGALPTIDAPPIAAAPTCGAGEVLVGNTCLVDPIDNPRLINPGQLPPADGGDTIAEIATNDVIDSGVLLAPIGGGAFDIDPIAP